MFADSIPCTMKLQTHEIRLIGRREYVDFPDLNIFHLEAKVDTGAYTSSLHCEDLTLTDEEGIPTLFFTLLDPVSQVKKEYRFTSFSTKKIRNSFGEMEERYLIKTLLKLGKKNIQANISLTNRDKMRYPVLIGRRPIKGKFVIDVKHIHIGGMRLKNFLKRQS